MPLFICAKCGCVDNTAMGHYWCVRAGHTDFPLDSLPEELRDKPLCTECAPSVFADGSSSGYGVWHDKFQKQSWEKFIGVFYDKKPDDPLFLF